MNLIGNERILVLKPSSLGDIVHALPAVNSIHRAFPEVRIDWLANTEWCPLLEGSPILDRVIPFPRRDFRGLSGLFAAKKWAAGELRKNSYDLAIDFQGLLRSALLAKLSKAKAIHGFSNAREGAHMLYGSAICVQDWERKHAVERNCELVQMLGIETIPIEFPLPRGDSVSVPDSHEDGAVLLHPFSRGTGKSLSVKEVTELCRNLQPHPVILVGRAELPPGTVWPENVVDLLNQTSLPQLIHLLRRAAWTVSVDSGPMHLAAAVSDRVLSIHTWSNPATVGPWCPEAYAWREGKTLSIRECRSAGFQERRDLKKHFANSARLLDPSDVETIADFTKERLTA
ncbi:MAG: glycosyltransferase family 9 protein [Verrucomicrobiales bacterium]|nr:glycosyltransferase family 9 protein [Verrucomicrobiales bacterium]